jgi:hypothetical protein
MLYIQTGYSQVFLSVKSIMPHLDAGADDVQLGTIAPGFQADLDALERLAPVLAWKATRAASSPGA